MKILLVNQFFWPDVAASGQFLTDLASHLGQDHEVTVICSAGSYDPMQTTGDQPPVRIIRIAGMSFQRGAIGRALCYGMFLMGAICRQFFLPRQDVIVTMTTPPLLAIAGRLLKAVRGTRHYIWEMDVFPDVFVSSGVLPENGWITRLLSWIEDSCRKKCDGIITLGSCMRKRLIARGIPQELVHVAENWADGSSIAVESYRKSGPLHVLYSGNLGLAHEIDTIAEAMYHFRSDPRFLFTFAGGGVSRDELQQICTLRGISNVQFLPYVSRDRLSSHLALADVGLVTERPSFLGTMVPSKIYGLMSAGRPILFIGPAAATPGLLVRRLGCGWWVEPGDPESLIDLLERLYANREEIALRGHRARSAFDRNYDQSNGVERVAALFGLGQPRRAHLEAALAASTEPIQ
jgi:colanic acid biosynthesis glycosyl transferase WcaI